MNTRETHPNISDNMHRWYQRREMFKDHMSQIYFFCRENNIKVINRGKSYDFFIRDNHYVFNTGRDTYCALGAEHYKISIMRFFDVYNDLKNGEVLDSRGKRV